MQPPCHLFFVDADMHADSLDRANMDLITVSLVSFNLKTDQEGDGNPA